METARAHDAWRTLNLEDIRALVRGNEERIDWEALSNRSDTAQITSTGTKFAPPALSSRRPITRSP